MAAVVAAALVLCGVVYPRLHRRHVLARRVWRIGVDNSLPYHLLRPDGTVGGFAAEAVDEAARRAGLRCEWKRISDDAVAALRAGEIDIFPDLTDLPSRRSQGIYFSAPWIQNDYCLLTLKSGGLSSISETRDQPVAYVGRFVMENIATRWFAGMRSVRKPDFAQAMQAVCSGEAKAVMLEYRAAKTLLLDRPEGCYGVAFRFVPATISSPVSVGSNAGAAAAAEAIRDELGAMAREDSISADFRPLDLRNRR